MLSTRTVAALLLLTFFLAADHSPGFQGGAAGARDENPSSLEEVVRRLTEREKQVTESLRDYNPMIEAYIQRQLLNEDGGAVPKEDQYLLGRLEWKKGVRTKPFLREQWKAAYLLRPLAQPFSIKPENLLDVFAGMVLLDRTAFDEKRYDFRFIRREFLGEMRCLVFEVKPERKVSGGFSGRIWVEDREFTIVRFNGVSANRESLHFDSWRVNARPGLWLPAYVYAEDSDQSAGFIKRKQLRSRAQTRFWGYAMGSQGHRDEYTALIVDGPAVRDRSDSDRHLSPVESQRAWERQAEDNVLERLEAAGLLAPEGEVDKVLKTVITNLEITNNLQLDPEVRCRILLTSPFEAFTVGHTIVLSRGLIDVLPDEGSLAAMLAHEMGHMILGHQPIDTQYAFSDRMLVPDQQLLDSFRFGRSGAEESAADARAMELLQHSPYKDKLANAGLFLRTVSLQAKQLPSLIQSHLGDGIAEKGEIRRMSELMRMAPELEHERVDQIAALPLGGRIEVDPWSGHLRLVKAKPVPLVSSREKMPLEVTPFMPYLSYFRSSDRPIAQTPNPPR